MSQTLSEKREESLNRLREAQQQQQQLAVSIERLVGRLQALDELIAEEEGG